jgi:iron complex transport system ATP-binding protein
MSTLLKAESLTFAYPNAAAPVLYEVSLTLAAGQVVALLGPNGSGKSTLIRVLLGQLPAAGSVEWDSRLVSNWNRRELARHVAYLPQSPLWEPQQTVLEVLRLGRAPYWSAFGIESERDVNAVNDVAVQLGLQDILHRRLDELSGGQRQRLFLGRCLVQQPRAMLLDEPNTFLDLHHQVELCRLLRGLAKEKSLGVLLASHDLNLAAAFADRLLLLHEGKIVAAGTPDEVLKPELLSQVYAVPMRRLDPSPGQPIVFPEIK